MRRFESFACFDWSGQAIARPKGIALAIARAGVSAPALVASGNSLPGAGNWSRQDALDWLVQQAREQTDMLIGIDFSFAMPFSDRSAYFPGWEASPSDAKALWGMIDILAAGEDHLSASTIPVHPEMSRHFRYRAGIATHVGDLFEPGFGRLRITEKACRANRQGNAASCFNLIGASQVGKSSLTGMRLLHRLADAIPVWPFDPIPETGPVLVEIYTALAARAAGMTGPTKMRDATALDTALAALGARPHTPLPRYDDHGTDAILTAAWLRRASREAALWNPIALDAIIARTEGWTFGVP